MIMQFLCAKPYQDDQTNIVFMSFIDHDFMQ